MATSTQAWYLYPPGPGIGGAGEVPPPGAGIYPEGAPAILWGQGTPAAIAPFTIVNKGSLYMTVDQTDDTTAVYLKVDEGGDAADWAKVFAENEALIDTNDLAAAAGIKVEQLETNALSNIVLSELFDISAADSEKVVLHAVAALTITEIGLLWEEATGASGAAEGDITVGTASAGAQIVTAAAYGVSKASGTYDALTIVSGAVAAGASVFASHDIAAGATGTYRLMIKYDLDS